MMPASVAPNPLRRVWLRRIALGTAGLCVVVLTLRLAAGFVADWHDAKLRERLKQRGVAMHIADLQPPAVPDAENAALLWERAIAALGTAESPRTSTFAATELGWYPPYKAKWHELADASAAADVAAFRLAVEASRLRRVDWGTDYRSGTFDFFRGLNQSRHLANRLADSFERLMLRGEQSTAMDHLLAVFALAEAVQAEPTLVRHLVGNGIDVLACDAFRRHVGGLRITKEGSADTISHAQAVRLLHVLLRPSDDSIVHVWNPELTFAIDPSSPFPARSAWVIQPILREFHRDRTAPFADAGDFADRIGDRPFNSVRNDPVLGGEEPGQTFGWNDVLRMDGEERLRVSLEGAYKWRSSRPFEMEAVIRTQRHIAAIALAMRWYQIDRDGQFPETLDALVPDYLPAIPMNHMSPDGLAFEYVIQRRALPDGGDRPLLVVAMPDGERGEPAYVPEYELLFSPDPGQDRSRGRWSDLTNWTPSPGQLRLSGRD